MSKKKRKQYNAQFKAKVALEALCGHKTAVELSSQYGVHHTVIHRWKKLALEGLPSLFDGNAREPKNSEDETAGKLYEQIGRLKVELDWLKKNSDRLG